VTPGDDPKTERRACPTCGAKMAPQQDWCLNCGSAATTEIVNPPGWRAPVAIVLGVVLVAGAALAFAVTRFTNDADKAAGPKDTTAARTATAKRPARTTRATPAPGTGTSRTTATSATTSTTATTAATGDVALWPPARKSYTVVLLSADTRSAAEVKARQETSQGRKTGILRSDDYDFFSPGSWVVWSGSFADKPTAQTAAQKAIARGDDGAYATFIQHR
jgi:ribosomal protein S27AE